jgi:hypothetical protein
MHSRNFPAIPEARAGRRQAHPEEKISNHHENILCYRNVARSGRFACLPSARFRPRQPHTAWANDEVVAPVVHLNKRFRLRHYLCVADGEEPAIL